MNYNLYNEDCLTVAASMASASIELCLTDIPYGEVNQKSGGLRKLDRKEANEVNFDVEKLCREAVRICTGSIYMFCGIGQISSIDGAFRSLGLTTRLCQWEKTNPSPMNGTRLWLSGSEFCVFARKPKATFHRHCEKPIWRFPSGKSKSHPTEKPVALMEYIIQSSSNLGDTVVDFTMGSGATGVAALNLGRKFIGVELDECHFRLAESRIFNGML